MCTRGSLNMRKTKIRTKTRCRPLPPPHIQCENTSPQFLLTFNVALSGRGGTCKTLLKYSTALEGMVNSSIITSFAWLPQRTLSMIVAFDFWFSVIIGRSDPTLSLSVTPKLLLSSAGDIRQASRRGFKFLAYAFVSYLRRLAFAFLRFCSTVLVVCAEIWMLNNTWISKPQGVIPTTLKTNKSTDTCGWSPNSSKTAAEVFCSYLSCLIILWSVTQLQCCCYSLYFCIVTYCRRRIIESSHILCHIFF